MKSIVKFFALSVLMIALVSPTFAQKKKKGNVINEAQVKYTITAEGGMAAAFSGSTVDLFFTPTNSKVLANVMNGMIQVDLRMDNKKKKGLMLMDMMGQKKMAEMGEEDMKQPKQENKKPTDVKYLNKYKKIAGYKCQEVKVSVDGMKEPATVYITEKIQAGNLDNVSMMQFTGLKGFPLAWEFAQDGTSVKMEATAVKLDKLPKSTFDMTAPEGYEKMSMEDLQGLGGTLGM